ncbi:hypothetical protein VTJ04DRAFT_6154 [Mycothermus thermophilus]|uniref:uncharacterized protein n=1 Tax=Humicola insolens TaxID=85995 RepID=UPI00374376C1
MEAISLAAVEPSQIFRSLPGGGAAPIARKPPNHRITTPSPQAKSTTIDEDSSNKQHAPPDNPHRGGVNSHSSSALSPPRPSSRI